MKKNISRDLLTRVKPISSEISFSSDRLLLIRIFSWCVWPWLFASCVFFPGFYSEDSIDALRQVVHGEWNNWQTTTYILLIYVFSFFGRILWLPNYVFGILLIFSLIFLVIQIARNANWTYERTRKVAFFLCSMPFVTLFGQIQWKDSPFVSAILIFLSFAIKNPKTISKHQRRLLLISLFCIVSLRWNGITSGVLLATAWVGINFQQEGSRKSFRVMMKFLLVCSLAFCSLILAPLSGAVEGQKGLFYNQTRIHDIAVVFNQSPEILSGTQVLTLESIAPITAWRKAGESCLDNNYLLFAMFPEYAPNSYDSYYRNENAVTKIWNSIVFKNPVAILKVHFCRARSSWDPILRYQVPAAVTVQIPAEGSKYKIESTSQQIPVRTLASGLVSKWPFVIYWSAPFFFYVSLFAFLIFRKRLLQHSVVKNLLIYGALLLAGVAISQNAQDLRYNFPALIIFQLSTISIYYIVRDSKNFRN